MKHICFKCKYCKITSAYDNCAAFYECKLHKTIDPITGSAYYHSCSDYNSNGDCKYWKQGGIITFIKRLFPKIMEE